MFEFITYVKSVLEIHGFILLPGQLVLQNVPNSIILLPAAPRLSTPSSYFKKKHIEPSEKIHVTKSVFFKKRTKRVGGGHRHPPRYPPK